MVATTDECKDMNEVSASEVQVAAVNEPTITDEDFDKAQKTFQLGKKNLFLNKYDESVNNIGEACKTYSTKYGEFGQQCGEVYFFYGRALLELARMENTVLGNALTGVPDESGPINDSRYGNPEDLGAEEKKEISDKVIDALCESEDKEKEAAAAAAATEKTEGKEEEATTKEKEEVAEKETPATVEDEKKKEIAAETTEGEKKEETTAKTTEGEKKEEAAAAEGEEEEEEGDEEGEEEEEETDEQAKDEAEAEDISSLQRSWEMFEMAKLVYQKHFDSEPAFKNKRIAECWLKLGEISIEQESYEQACTDIAESIRMQEDEKSMEKDERMLAESFYQLGLAEQFANKFSEAKESYQKSINIMQLRIEKLKAKMEQAPASKEAGDDIELEKTTWKDEIAELEALLPEMMNKLEEVQQGQQSLTLIKEAKECFVNNIVNANGGNAEAAAASGDVKDITSMVKSKRKANETSESSPSANEMSKKTKIEGEECAAPAATEEKIEVDEKEAKAVENKENETKAPEASETSAKTMEEPSAKVAEQITEAAAEITA